MLVDPVTLARALGLPASAEVEFEPLAGASVLAEIATVRTSEGSRRVVLRSNHDSEAAMNHCAVMEALTNAGFGAMPKLIGVDLDVAIESWVDGVTALQLVPPAGSAEAAIEALAALHALPVREGLRWGASPAEALPGPDVPLHRLGFAAHEREPAREWLQAMHEVLLEGPFGFVHGEATAANVLLAPGRAWLTEFSGAGFGAQLFDVAAFLLTCGLEAPARQALAARYAQARGLGRETADLVDLAGIAWGMNELLGLPRRQVETLGDDIATEMLRTIAVRIDRGIRQGAGSHPVAVALRAALWPA